MERVPVRDAAGRRRLHPAARAAARVSPEPAGGFHPWSAAPLAPMVGFTRPTNEPTRFGLTRPRTRGRLGATTRLYRVARFEESEFFSGIGRNKRQTFRRGQRSISPALCILA